MSRSICGLLLCLFAALGLVQADGPSQGRPKMTSYCLSFGGKCLPRCNSRSETEVEKLQQSCGAELRCCVGRLMTIPTDNHGKSSIGPQGLSTISRTTRSQAYTPTISRKTRPQWLTSTIASTTRLQPTYMVPQSTPSTLKSRSRLTFTSQKGETKLNTSFSSYKRYRKTEGCGVTVLDRVRRIVGGSQAERCTLPWMVYIARDLGKDDLCGGTLVSDRHVITAAHCYDFLGDSWPALYIGEYNRRDSNSRTKFVTSSYTVSRHPQYSRITFSYDIAILTLNIPIPLENYECLHPICLPEEHHALKPGDMCTVAGWGSTSRTEYKPAVSSPLLMKTQIRVLDDRVCQNKFGIYFNPRSQICAGDLSGKTDSCVGDSGGPLTCSMAPNGDQSSKKATVQVLMGVISSGGTPCAQADTPALYTDLQEVRDWIRSVLN